MKVRINFSGDLRMGSYWNKWTDDSEFEFVRYTKNGLCLLIDPEGKEVSLRKRNVDFPQGQGDSHE